MEITKLNLKYFDYNKWQLVENYGYMILEYTIIVPAGFITDLASTPKILWNIFEPFGKGYLKASVIHDYLYSKDCVYEFMDRKIADKIFLEIMKENGVNFIKRQVMYRAVRLFGKKFFRQDFVNGKYKGVENEI